MENKLIVTKRESRRRGEESKEFLCVGQPGLGSLLAVSFQDPSLELVS